jgi:predicted nuclease with RNAse H fold
LLEPSETDELRAWAADAEAVCVDAPASVSNGPHASDETLSEKFRQARCAEIALGREFGYWVPWPTPLNEMKAGWMVTGLVVYFALRAQGVPALEYYPYAGFRELAGSRLLPKKQTAAGIRVRVELLERAGVKAPDLAMWSHDSLDACLGAVVARQWAQGTAQRAGCGHDESAIWLPSPGS